MEPLPEPPDGSDPSSSSSSSSAAGWLALRSDAAELREVTARAIELSERLRCRRAQLCDRSGESVDNSVDDLVDDSVVDTPMVVRAVAARDLAAAVGELARLCDVLSVDSTQIALAAQVPLQSGHRSERRWLAQSSGIGRHQAASVVRAGTAEECFPLLSSAFEARRVHLGHLDAASTIIPQRLRGAERREALRLLHDLEPTLLDAAESMSVDEFARLCRQIRLRIDADGPEDRSRDASTLWLEVTRDGRFMVSGDLSADDGALISTMLTDRMERLRSRLRAQRGDAAALPMPTERELRAQALRELLVDGAGAARPGRVGVFLHIELDDLGVERDALDLLLGARAHTEADLDISDETLWALLADADVTPVFNHDGTPLSYGRTRRLAPEVLRHVLAHRDRRCRWPGCDLPAVRTVPHHVEHWADGGCSDPDDLAALCRFHHLAHHNHGWRIDFDLPPPARDPTRLRFAFPDGSPLITRSAQQRAAERELLAACRPELGLIVAA